MTKNTLLFFIIFLEGYVVLSAELLAIRQIIPFAGSGTDTISIIIAAVLMPLAFGYYAGGRFKRRLDKKNAPSVRQKLLRNILISAIFFALGLSYIIIELFFTTLSSIGIHNRLITTSLYALCFLVTPVFLLAQTIPLISHFFAKEKLNQITGKILFFSTVGSFMGAVFSTLILMATLGVHHTVSIIIGCLALLYLLLGKTKKKKSLVVMLGILVLSLWLNSDKQMANLDIVENNQYNTIRVLERKQGAVRILSLNNNNSSIYIDPSRMAFPERGNVARYINYINTNFITPIMNNDQPRHILVIGAGGFTVGLEDTHNEYVFIDIDKSLLKISEEKFLKKKLTDNKKFEATPARAYLSKALVQKQKFDLIIIDTYKGGKLLPEHLITREFFQDIKATLNPKGIVIGNFLTSSSFNNKFSMNLDNTLRQVFPHVTRQIIPQQYNGWSDNIENNRNILYIYHHKQNPQKGIYTDNKNRVYYDRDIKAQ